jgi:hypothetical protein
MGTIFKNVGEKIKKYDEQRRGKLYNEAYQSVLKARGENSSLVDDDGNVSEESLKTIEKALKKFGMARFGKMDDKFVDKLRKKLNDTKAILVKFRNLQIESQDWQRYEEDVKKLYDTLSVGGKDGLSADGDRFDVGATKIMNFLFPELFVMVDKNVATTLTKLGLVKFSRKGSTHHYCFEKYWKVMRICYDELGQYKKHGDLSDLLKLDKWPTTLTRIFDKCAFVMAHDSEL